MGVSEKEFDFVYVELIISKLPKNIVLGFARFIDLESEDLKLAEVLEMLRREVGILGLELMQMSASRFKIIVISKYPSTKTLGLIIHSCVKSVQL